MTKEMASKLIKLIETIDADNEDFVEAVCAARDNLPAKTLRDLYVITMQMDTDPSKK